MNKLLFFISALLILVSVHLDAQQSTIQQQSTDKGLTIKTGGMEMVVDAATGSRIVSFKFDREELLGSMNLNKRFYGSTLWLSPEGKWKGQGILDAGKYNKESFDGVDLRMQSQNDTLRGFSFTKEFHLNKADTSINIKYTMTNILKNMQEVAPWEVTRVPTGGLIFSPKRSEGDIPKANNMYPLLAIRDSIGIIWYPYDSSTASAQKLFMDGGEGWIAFVLNNMIFVKKFPVIQSDKAAPNEQNVELYVNKEKTYVELENQGIYQKLNMGDYLTYNVKWYARRLPTALKIEIGNEALVTYVRNLIKNKSK
jgi:hypothetical protein